MSTASTGIPHRVKAGVLLATLCLSSLLLASCGGSGSDAGQLGADSVEGRKEALAVSGTWTGRAPKYEVINGITVPPEPAPTLNNSTLAGVDINNNGVRDDVERRVAEKSPNSSSFNAGLKIASITQNLLTAPKMTQQEMDKMQRDLNCAAIAFIESGGKTSDTSIVSLILNSPPRLAAYKDKTANYKSGIVYINDGGCK